MTITKLNTTIEIEGSINIEIFRNKILLFYGLGG